MGTGWVLEMAMKEAAAAAKRLKGLRQMQGEVGVHILRLKRRILVRALSSSATHVILTVARSSVKLVPVVCDSCLQVQPFLGGPKRLHSSIEDIYHTTLSLPIHSF